MPCICLSSPCARLCWPCRLPRASRACGARSTPTAGATEAAGGGCRGRPRRVKHRWKLASQQEQQRLTEQLGAAKADLLALQQRSQEERQQLQRSNQMEPQGFREQRAEAQARTNSAQPHMQQQQRLQMQPQSSQAQVIPQATAAAVAAGPSAAFAPLAQQRPALPVQTSCTPVSTAPAIPAALRADVADAATTAATSEDGRCFVFLSRLLSFSLRFLAVPCVRCCVVSAVASASARPQTRVGAESSAHVSVRCRVCVSVGRAPASPLRRKHAQ